MAWGITDFECHPESGKFVFPAAGSLYACVDPPPSSSDCSSALSPFHLRSRCRLARLNAALCPANPDLVAFVGDFDLWAAHLTSGDELRLTHSHSGASSLASNPISTGLPSYVMQEEFNRFTGVWWRPVVEGGGRSKLGIKLAHSFLLC